MLPLLLHGDNITMGSRPTPGELVEEMKKHILNFIMGITTIGAGGAVAPLLSTSVT